MGKSVGRNGEGLNGSRETIYSCKEYRVDRDINDGALFAYDKEGIFITCINSYIKLRHFKLIVEDILKNGYEVD